MREFRNYTRSAEHALLISTFECSFKRLAILTLAVCIIVLKVGYPNL